MRRKPLLNLLWILPVTILIVIVSIDFINHDEIYSAFFGSGGVLVEKAVDVTILINLDNPLPDDYSPVIAPVETYINDTIVSYPYDCMINPEAGKALAAMLINAKENGIDDLIINSAYRSKNTQQGLWETRLAEDPHYGDDPKASPVKVLPGNASEHTTGLAIDILSHAHNVADDAYARSDAGKWLAANAHIFGFILRYPKDKENITGVIFEPWHFRYVGIDIAKYCYENGLCLEEYYDRQ